MISKVGEMEDLQAVIDRLDEQEREVAEAKKRGVRFDQPCPWVMKEAERDTDALLKEAVAMVKRMTPEQRDRMWAEQAKSWARGMAPCEHGVSDWEECGDCRQARS